MGLGTQAALLFLLAIPIACVSWTITHEEIFREPRDWCVSKSKSCRTLLERKFFYLFTCEDRFSHWVTFLFLVMTRYHLWLPDWRGYVLAEFALVWIANVYMGAYVELKLEIRHDRQVIQATDEKLAKNDDAAATRPVEVPRSHRA